MASIGIVYGSTNGNTERVAEMVKDELGEDGVEILNIAEASPEQVLAFDVILVGIPTWNTGELQEDWENFFPKMDEMDFNGKKVAFFGLGDVGGYPDTYQDAMGILYEKVIERGATVIGWWPTEGYDFSESKAIFDGKFCGLCIDEDTEADLTDERIKTWAAQLRSELGLGPAPAAASDEAAAPAEAEASAEEKPSETAEKAVPALEAAPQAAEAEGKPATAPAEAPTPEKKPEAVEKIGPAKAAEAKTTAPDPTPTLATTPQPSAKPVAKAAAAQAASRPAVSKPPAKKAPAKKVPAKRQAVTRKPAAPLPPPPVLTSRRGFINWAVGAWLVFFAWLAGIGHLFLRFMFPRVLYEKNPKFDAGKPSYFSEKGKVYEQFKESQAVWLVRLDEEGEDHLVALSTVCTHLGCTPNWLQAEQKFKCPCHGSGYYKNGVNFEGPAPRPLERYRIRVNAAGEVIVNKSTVFRQDLQQWGQSGSFIKMS